MNRRYFMFCLSQCAVGALCAAQLKLIAATYGTRKLTTIGAQLYTVRRELERDFEGTLAHITRLGYREVEFAGYFNKSPKEVKAALARLGLTSPAAHVQLSDLRSNLGNAIEAAGIIGHRYLLLAWTPPEERKSLDDYRRLADLCNKAAEQTKRAGIQFAYHNHDFEFLSTEGRIPYDILLERMSSELVKLEMDIYWTVKGGANPIDYFNKYPGRFHLLHVKDMDSTPRHYFTEVGRGVIDFKSIFAHARKSGVRHYFIEQDETPGSPFESLKVSIDYLKQLEF